MRRFIFFPHFGYSSPNGIAVMPNEINALKNCGSSAAC